MDIANLIGKHLLSFQNSRVVSPPGKLTRSGRRNIVVATPPRSGTHVLIDLILNNLVEYKRAPLYVDLDQYIGKSLSTAHGEQVLDTDSGYVVKTHYPLYGYLHGTQCQHQCFRDRIVENAVVLAVHRDTRDILRSLETWNAPLFKGPQQFGNNQDEEALSMFWEHWNSQRVLVLNFAELFDANRMNEVLSLVSNATGATKRRRFVGPPPRSARAAIYANKAATRVFGAAAPRIDTTIHSVK